ncbi:UvrB/UvrC motif-containing protein [Neobacillus sp. CF12]|uniref:UvrB/UvrC motif-containing protein n=1 Tax=Neobacillus sp. CF12 TaxID=3055864 RepID=UPI0025A0034D|nr:UvrB/UvrC motif-containing protein [Neobacillus sp. CF12]MDM5328575.1 UvrB/UvrC motif-containing protein [Neobacillus sp. CF12]
MKDSQGTIIYVGKAKNLKRRVQSYFQQSKAHPQKIIKLVSNIRDFDILLTDTEFEAFMLECKLIREIKPLFNKMMKSPQSYSYIVIDKDTTYPEIKITNYRDEQDGRLYFGPFPSKARVETTIMGIKEAYKILCSNPKRQNSLCFNHSIGLCIGMCGGGPALQEYHAIMENIIALLNGENRKILDHMKKKMAEAAADFDFEAAARYRDRIDSTQFLLRKEKVIEFTEENKNLVVIENLSEDTFKFFLIKRNEILFRKIITIDSAEVTQLSSLITKIFNATDFPVSNHVKRDELDEAQIIYNYIKSSHCRYKAIPDKWIRNQKDKNIVEAVTKLIYKKQTLKK